MRPVSLLLFLLLVSGCDLLNPRQIDLDADGFPPETDCDDEDAAVNPEAGERCDGKDNDCDGSIDEGFDEDGDGQPPCGPFPDCNDSDPAVFPGAPELCNGVDDDCDGVVDNGSAGGEDADGDGVSGCDGDCDDTDPNVYPGALELCDGKDGNCDGELAPDEVDGDGDGAVGCPGVDCDDANPGVYPGAVEVCDEVDQDCDGLVDEDFDADGDGVSSCSTPPDCDDSDPSKYPGAPEQCDGVDNDCDGQVDEDTSADGDGDGVSACSGDCDDTDPFVFPGAFEHPNGGDDDCDGAVDEGWSGVGNAGALGAVGVGTATLEGRGARLSDAGDFNGDGRSDFVTSNPTHNGGAGRAWLYLGQGFPVSNPPALTPIATVSGGAGAALGESTALADLDGDGYDDLIIGAPESTSSSPPNGAVYIYWGSPVFSGGAWPLAAADVTIAGAFSTEQCGALVADAGDVNADGRDDLLVGCPWFDPGGAGSGLRGRTLLFLGRTRAQWGAVSTADDATTRWVGTSAETETPTGLASAGDHNGDGYDDFLIGSTNYDGGNGRVGVILGGPTSIFGPTYSLDQAHRLWTGTNTQGVGACLAGGGNNGDAYDDVLIGAPNSNGTRGYTAFVIGGASPWALPTLSSIWEYVVFGSVATEEAGSACTFADLDGDGLSDTIAPTPGYDGPLGGDQGRVSILPGPNSLYPEIVDPGAAPVVIEGEAGGDGFGSAVASLPDFNGDGAPDVVVGAPWSDLGAPGGGAVYILLGAP